MWRWWNSNPQPQACKARAHPLELHPHICLTILLIIKRLIVPFLFKPPFSFIFFMLSRRISKSQPPPYQGDTLPLSYGTISREGEWCYYLHRLPSDTLNVPSLLPYIFSVCELLLTVDPDRIELSTS